MMYVLLPVFLCGCNTVLLEKYWQVFGMGRLRDVKPKFEHKTYIDEYH